MRFILFISLIALHLTELELVIFYLPSHWEYQTSQDFKPFSELFNECSSFSIQPQPQPKEYKGS